MHFCKVHSIGPINVRTNFGTQLTNLENMQKSHVTVRRTSDMYFDQEHFETKFKSNGSNSGFNVFDDLDLWPMSYCLSHKVGMKYWHLHRNPSRVNGWYGRG